MADPPYPLNKLVYYSALETLGHTKTLCEKRVAIYDNVEKCSNFMHEKDSRGETEDIDIIVAGSRGEGTGISFDSDLDILYVQRLMKCFEPGSSSVEKAIYPVVFELDFENVPPGYAKLRLEHLFDRYLNINKPNFLAKVRDSLVTVDAFSYLRNDMLLMVINRSIGWFKQQFVFDDVVGPARSFSMDLLIPNIYISVDRVFAFRCSYPSAVEAWCKRDRKYGWPNNDLIKSVKDLDIIVVPAGVRDTTDEALQWRISFTLTERELVRSFNGIQIKVFAALKMLTKRELKPICENITSYTVKNIVFWVFEENALGYTPDHFNDILWQGLAYLRACITWRYLPNYMMPSRNMLESKVSQRQKVELTQHIDVMIKEGPHVLLRCPIINQMFLSTVDFQTRLLFRELGEQVVLAIFSLSPTIFYKIFKQISDRSRTKKVHIVQIIFEHVFPVIRNSNPFGFFNHVISMSDEEILFHILQGAQLKYCEG